MKTCIFATAAAAALLAGSVAQATDATATTDLNMRSGPGPWYDVVGVIDGDAAVTVDGCLEAENWCQVSYNGMSGWAYGDYLTAKVGDAPMALTAPEARSAVEVNTVTYTEDKNSTAKAAGFGTVVGALVGGPVGAAAGAVIGGTAGAVNDLDTTTTTYVTAHPVPPVYLNGEVVVGAGVPAEVALTPIPDSNYSYAYVNNVPVVIDSGSRTIVTIVR